MRGRKFTTRERNGIAKANIDIDPNDFLVEKVLLEERHLKSLQIRNRETGVSHNITIPQ